MGCILQEWMAGAGRENANALEGIVFRNECGRFANKI